MPPLSLVCAIAGLVEGFGRGSPRKHILLIGAGEAIGLVATELPGAARTLTVASSDAARAETLARRLAGGTMSLREVPARLDEFDVVIAATASARPVIDRATASDAMRRRRGRPMLMIDLAVPHNIDSAVNWHGGVLVHRLDDLLGSLHPATADRDQTGLVRHMQRAG